MVGPSSRQNRALAMLKAALRWAGSPFPRALNPVCSTITTEQKTVSPPFPVLATLTADTIHAAHLSPEIPRAHKGSRTRGPQGSPNSKLHPFLHHSSRSGGHPGGARTARSLLSAWFRRGSWFWGMIVQALDESGGCDRVRRPHDCSDPDYPGPRQVAE